MVLHMRFESLYISSLSSAKQQREITKSYLVIIYLVYGSFETVRHTEQIYTVATFEGEI